MGDKKPVGILLGLAGNVAIGWALYHFLQIGSCGGVNPPCPGEAWKYFVALPVGILASVLSIFLGGGAFAFAGIFIAIGVGSLASAIWGDNEETTTFSYIFGGAFLFFGLLPLVGGLAMRPWRKAKIEKAEKLVATGGRGIGTVIDVQDTGITINDNPRVKLRMRVEPTDGSAAFEREKTITASRVAIPRVGDRYPVFYDRTDPETWAFGTDMDANAAPDIRALFAAAQAGSGSLPPAFPAPPAAPAPAPAPAPAAAVAPVADPIAEISRLNELRMQGAISDGEFQVAKDRLLAQLGRGAAPPA